MSRTDRRTKRYPKERKMQFNPGPMYVPPSVVSRAADTSCSHGRIVMLPGDAWSDEVKVFKTDADYQQAIAEAEAELAAAIAAAEKSIAALREAAK